jgi:hypothetical protein
MRAILLASATVTSPARLRLSSPPSQAIPPGMFFHF